jgi:amino acid adenylation domain-containing protein
MSTTGLSRSKRALLDALLRAEGMEESDAIPRRSGGGPAPLSFAQERLWFLAQMEPESPRYNVPHAVRLSGALDEDALRGALTAIVARHEALRTVFHAPGGSPVQVVLPARPFDLPLHDLGATPAGLREAELLRLAREEAERLFDLSAEPPFRARLVRLAGDDHALFLTLHHVVADGWSVGLLFHELSALYDAFRASRASPLGELEVQYADYAVWQREKLGGSALEGQLAYWSGVLAGAPPVLELPTDHLRPALRSGRGGRVRVRTSAETGAAVRALARAENATPYMALLAAWALLLARYSGQREVVVGTPIAGRERPEVEAVIGFFANTLAMRTDLTGEPTFRALLGRVRETALGAYAHAELPFERLVQELQPVRSLSVTPLFQAALTLQNASSGGAPVGLRLAGLDIAPVGAGSTSAKFDLTLVLGETADGGYAGVLEYAADLYEEDTARRMAGHFEALLAAAVAEPEARAWELPWLGDEERRVLVEEWGGGATPYPGESTVAELFAEAVTRRPDAVAVEAEGERLTYAELDERSGRLASYLVRRGTAPEARVGVLLERSAELIVALLGILKAGAAYVPLDPAYPAERLRFMMADAGVGLVLTRSHLLPSLPSGQAEAVCLDTERGEIEANEPASVRVPSDCLAYVTYTSGSTGRPKGVAISHRSIARLVRDTDYAVLDETPVFLQFGPLAFDASTLEIWGSLLNGARLMMFPPQRPTLEMLGEVVQRSGVTAMYLTASLFQQMVEKHLDGLRGVRQLFAGGDALPAVQVRTAVRELPGVRVINGYGPTECTTFSCCHTLDAASEVGHSVSIGRPIANTTAYVLDPYLRPVPIGVMGELYIGGPGLARGYLGRPALTAERFVPDPFGAPGGRLYRTGDRVRWLADGTQEFFGRLDQQVKVRGFRIEPAEVEAALAEHPSVREVAVVARADRPGEKRLVAYLVADAPVPSVTAFRAFLKERLPEYMVPSAFVALDAFPLSPNGKLERSVLPAPDGVRPELESAYVEPRTGTERTLADIWAEVLGVERVGAEDDFFDLGGHSLLATRVVSRIREALGAEMPLRALFEHPTLEALAEQVADAAASTLPPVRPAARPERVPLSFAQERLWLVDQLQPGSAAYNVPLALRLQGTLDVDALRRALAEIVRRHEALRTVFPVLDGSPAQVVMPAGPVALPLDDLRALVPEAREAVVKRRVNEEARRPFDLARGPLVAARLLRLADEEHVLVVCMHHVVTDGWSMGIFTRELSALYGAFREGRPSPLPELQVQYADYALWQREHLDRGALAAQVEYWKGKLAGAPRLLELPTDHPRPQVQGFSGAKERFTVSPEVTEQLRALAQREGSTLFMVLLAGWQLLLSRYSGQTDVVVGTTLAGRTRHEVEPLIGMFFNTLPLRTDLSGDPGFPELLARVRETTLEAYAHQDVPFDRLLDEVRVERSPGASPLVQALFELQNTPALGVALPGLTPSPVRSELGTAKIEMSLVMLETATGMSGVLQYASDLFEPESMRRMLSQFSVLLAGIAEDARRPLSALPVLGDEERREVLSEWNDTDRPFPPATLHGLFEDQLRRTPDALALVQGDRRLSFAELDTMAGEIAALLHRRGAGPEVRVALLLERTPELIAALLGVLKAGAAYLPLDPTHPAERLAYMVGDAGARIILTHTPLRAAAEELAGAAGSQVVGVEERTELDTMDRSRPDVGPEHLAYVYYTSGSTGRPKGVAMHHRGICNYVQWAVPAYGADREGGAPVFTSIAVDLTLANLLPLFAGRPVELLPEGPALEALAERLRTGASFSLIKITPTHLALLNALLSPEEARRAAGTLVIGADNLLAEPTRFWQDEAPEVRLLNEYGPTETVVGCALYALPPGRHRTGRVPIGRAIENLRMYVLDAHMQPAPVGIAGELYIGGVGVARGYLGRPGLTAEKFVPDPFGEPGARLYRTGDRARWRNGGQMEFLGRLDHQVKVRGYRVEPGEVEAVLREHEGVRAAAVVVREDARGDAGLVAYVVPAGAVAANELRAHLKRRVPEYMVPGAIVLMDELPLGTTGKLDPSKLPAPEPAHTAPESRVEPRTETERALAAIWAEVLGVEGVGAEDNFFDLGGHSLPATRVVSSIRDVLGVEVPLRALFEHPTLKALAAQVEGAGTATLPPVHPVARPERVPLSFAQERLWLVDQLQPGGAAYNVPLALRLQGALEVDALGRALAEIVRRHEALRTVFPLVDGAPAQVVKPAGPVPLSIEDAADEAELLARVREEARRPFSLAEGPLVRARLLRLDHEDHVLIVCIHHIVTDGWSMGIFTRELSALYGAFREGRPSPLPEPELQYADYALWQRQHMDGGAPPAQLAYWREKLAGAPPVLELPIDRPRRAAPRHLGGKEYRMLPAERAERLRALARAEGATLYMVLLAAWQAVLSRFSGQTDVVVGTSLAGRTRREVEGVIGFFLNTIPLRTDLSGDPAFGELLGRVRETTLGAQAHQDVPLDRLVDELRLDRTPGRSPLVQVLFELQNAPRGERALPGLRVRRIPGALSTAKFDLTLFATETDEGVGLTLEYDADLFDAATAERLLGWLDALLAGAEEDPSAPLGALLAARPAEASRQLDQFNADLEA